MFREALLPIVAKPSQIAFVWKLMLEGIQLHQARENRNLPTVKNPMFLAAAEGVRDLLGVDPNRQMALWSGGIELTRYAEAEGYTPLERTPFGRILEDLKNRLYADWKPIGSFWDHLAHTFVQGASAEVHVFIRAHDPKSSLLSVEVPEIAHLRSRGKDIKIKWHSLSGKGELKRPCEINDRGGLVDVFTFDSETRGARALEEHSWKSALSKQNTTIA